MKSVTHWQASAIKESRYVSIWTERCPYDDQGLPLNRFVVRIDVPSGIWRARETLAADDLEPAWQAIPAGQTSADIGSSWLRSRRSVMLLVPSVIVPEESAALINTGHPEAATLNATVWRPFDYDRLFRGV